MPESLNGDPSQFFVGGSDFDKAVRKLHVSVVVVETPGKKLKEEVAE